MARALGRRRWEQRVGGGRPGRDGAGAIASASIRGGVAIYGGKGKDERRWRWGHGRLLSWRGRGASASLSYHFRNYLKTEI